MKFEHRIVLGKNHEEGKREINGPKNRMNIDVIIFIFMDYRTVVL